jgi:hypothetical protein
MPPKVVTVGGVCPGNDLIRAHVPELARQPRVGRVAPIADHRPGPLTHHSSAKDEMAGLDEMMAVLARVVVAEHDADRSRDRTRHGYEGDDTEPSERAGLHRRAHSIDASIESQTMWMPLGRQ